MYFHQENLLTPDESTKSYESKSSVHIFNIIVLNLVCAHCKGLHVGEFYRCKRDCHGTLTRVKCQLYRRVRVRVRQTFMPWGMAIFGS